MPVSGTSLHLLRKPGRPGDSSVCAPSVNVGQSWIPGTKRAMGPLEGQTTQASPGRGIPFAIPNDRGYDPKT